MVRRAFLIGLAALPVAAHATSMPDPLAGVSRALRKRLSTCARAIELHRWTEVIGYFDPDHHVQQYKLFFSIELNEDPLNPADPEVQTVFVEWFLLRSMGLVDPELLPLDLDEIEGFRYTGADDPGGEGPIRIRFEVQSPLGPRSGGFWVDRETLAFSGASE